MHLNRPDSHQNHEKFNQGRFKQRIGRKVVPESDFGQSPSCIFQGFIATWLIWGAI
jgi:hypothetical protein